MKKIFIFIIYIFFLTNSFAETPYYTDSVNENVEYNDWYVVDTKIFSNEKFTTEIISLQHRSQRFWELKCIIYYYPDNIKKNTKCILP